MNKVETLKEFLATPKPEWCLPVDVVLLAQLVLDEGKPYAGHEALAARCGLRDDKAIVRSLGRLKAAGWIIKGDKGSYSVQADKLPKGTIK